MQVRINYIIIYLRVECTYPAISLDLYGLFCNLAVQYNTGTSWLSLFIVIPHAERT